MDTRITSPYHSNEGAHGDYLNSPPHPFTPESQDDYINPLGSPGPEDVPDAFVMKPQHSIVMTSHRASPSLSSEARHSPSIKSPHASTSTQYVRRGPDTKSLDYIKKRENRGYEYAEYVRMTYNVDQTPPWYLTILLGFQHYLIMFGATVANPLALREDLCIAVDDYQTLSQLVGTIFVVAGISTLLQTTLGVRLPLIQGGTFIFVVPSKAILNLPLWKCPENVTSSLDVMEDYMTKNNITEPLWKPRIREIQGAILVAGAVEFLLGISGIMGFMVRFIGPLAIAPTITLAGLALFNVAADKSRTQWWITLVTVILIVAFSQYTKNIRVPCCKFQRGQGFVRENIALFRLFPVILAVSLTWMICAILTAANVFPSGTWQQAKTSLHVEFLKTAPWFKFPYPGQWGFPTVSSAGVVGMFAGVLASMVESMGDYYACARLARLPSPPLHAINRGLTVEGLGCLLAGAFGSGSGTTSYSENIGAIGITKVASRRVFQLAALFMLIFGTFGKFGAIFATIPEPIIGGVFIIMFGMIAAVGLSNLQFVDLNSSRNLFIIGFSLFFGLTLPPYISANHSTIRTGSEIADQIIIVLLSTNMFVGGLAGFVLDNTIPVSGVQKNPLYDFYNYPKFMNKVGAILTGTRDERGILRWRTEFETGQEGQMPSGGLSAQNTPGGPGVQLPTVDNDPIKTYNIPKLSYYLHNKKWAQYIPISPTFNEELFMCCGKKKKQERLRHHSAWAQSREAITQL